MTWSFNSERRGQGTVAIVITTYNHARFLREALQSARGQTRPPDEVIVVDDGSQDDPAAVVREFPEVRLIRQENAGLAAARNTGLAATDADKIVFLDADDLLHSVALELGLATFERAPDAAMVYGAYRRIDAEGNVTVPYQYGAIGADPYVDFLTFNMVGMHATVMFARRQLAAAGGYDPACKRCEDYDVYLRLARTAKVLSHDVVVADYRWHGSNMSANPADMLDWVLRVHDRQREPAAQRPETREAWQEGRRRWRDYYAEEALQSLKGKRLAPAASRLASALGASPMFTTRRIAGMVKRRLLRDANPFAKRWPPRVGSVNFGDLGSTRPISRDFGFDRGTPIDRYYVEGFLSRHAVDIRGRVLEVGDATYCKRFGGTAITQQDVLHVSPRATGATIIGDLAQTGVLPEAAFDCMVLTQTLHLIYDMRLALGEIVRALRPGGILLLTVPGISQMDRGEWNKTWSWSLTPYAARRLFGEFFSETELEVSSHGNVFAATAFLQGVALEEVDSDKLDDVDAVYPVIVSVRARKSSR